MPSAFVYKEAVVIITENQKHKGKAYIEKILPYLLSAPAMIFIVVFLLMPLIYCLYCSFWRCDYMNFTKYVGLQNYADVLGNSQTLESIGLSFFISLISLVLALVSGVLLALWINTAEGRSAYILEIMILIPWTTYRAFKLFAGKMRHGKGSVSLGQKYCCNFFDWSHYLESYRIRYGTDAGRA